MAAVSAVLLDKDGTVVPLHPRWTTWAQRVLDVLADSAPRSAIAAALDVDATSGQLDPDGLLAVGTVAAVEAALVSVLLADGGGSPGPVRATVRTALERATVAVDGLPASPTPGVVDMLEQCWRDGIPVAIVTNDRRSGTLAELAAMGILGFIRAVVCGDDGLEPKPSGAMLRAACVELGVPPKDALMVGDTLVDRLAAEDAGVPFVLVRSTRPGWAHEGTAVVGDLSELTHRLP